MKVLFVCSGNACRSPAAEALLKKCRPDIEVDSAGTHAYYKIIDVTRNYLKQKNAVRYLKAFPESLSTKNLNNYDLIVAMEPKHKEFVLKKYPNCASRIVVWNIDDPYNVPIEKAEKIFNQIQDKAKKLVESFKNL